MNELSFEQLDLLPEIKRAIDEMGFETATGIQSEAIPLIKTGADVIGRSQTGTGKTLAFGIPALEIVENTEEKNSLQVLILCPTRELAQQACDEIKKLAKYMHGIRAVEVYGGVPMDRQILRLKKANIVIGTPGRIMDHMRRKTIKLDQIRMAVLDEADEMLSMGFKEDIETILADAPAERQTVLFSATMPPAILALTKEFQKDPQLIEINKKQVTLENIQQHCVDVPMGRKLDALNLLLRYYIPKRAMIFCNTKRMVDEVTDYLLKNDFSAAGLHGDMNQSQRTKTLDAFKGGKTSLLVATDVAARGIDVNDIDYVINYDIPQNTEYYVHRIGRTGRAGKSGAAITICSGRRQVFMLRDIARMAKSEIRPMEIPTLADIRQKDLTGNLETVKAAVAGGIGENYTAMLNDLLSQGIAMPDIAAAALELAFGKAEKEVAEIKPRMKGTRESAGQYRKISISIGRSAHCAPNHIVGAIAEQTGLSGGDIGKIEIFDDKTIVAIPADKLEMVVDSMQNLKICGHTTTTTAVEWKENGFRREDSFRPRMARERDSQNRKGNGYGSRNKPYHKKG